MAEEDKIEQAFKELFPLEKDNGALSLDSVYHPQHLLFEMFKAGIEWYKQQTN